MQALKGDGESIPYHKRAIELDPNFARAYASLGMAQYNLRESSAASENFRKAFELRDRVSERERFYIEAAYYSFGIGDLEKANEVYKQWAQEYPNESAPHVNLALNYEVMGEFEKAAEQSRLAIEVAPSAVTGYANLMAAYIALDRVDEALAIFQQAKQLGLDNEYLREMRYGIAFLQNDEAEMKHQMQSAASFPEPSPRCCTCSLTPKLSTGISRRRARLPSVPLQLRVAKARRRPLRCGWPMQLSARRCLKIPPKPGNWPPGADDHRKVGRFASRQLQPRRAPAT